MFVFKWENRHLKFSDRKMLCLEWTQHVSDLSGGSLIHVFPLREKVVRCWEDFPDGTSGKEPVCQCRRYKRRRFDPWVGKIPGEGRGNPFQFSCPKNPMDRGDWRAIVHRITHSRTQLKQLSTHTQGAQNGGRVCSLSASEGQIRVKRIRQLGVRGQCSRSLRWSSVKSVYPYCESALTSLVLPFRLLFLCHFEGTGSLRF